VEKGTLIHCWWECKLVQPLWKTKKFCLVQLWLKIYLPLMLIESTWRKTQLHTCVSEWEFPLPVLLFPSLLEEYTCYMLECSQNSQHRLQN
jgi:hypothetical protein